MVVERTRDEILAHENDKEYMANRVDWVKGKILDVSDYRKISVDSNEELMILAKIGQLMADQVVPGAKLFFTQAVLVGAAMLSRELADKFGLDFEKYRSVLMVTPTRYGKLCHDDTPVLTTKGWKKHGDLEPGDIVFHPSGRPTVVVSKTPKMKVNYKVVFSNGEEIYTHANHEWQVYSKKSETPHVVETRELEGVRRNTYFVDATSRCQFITYDQPFDPYLLGCWLGGEHDGIETKEMTKAYGGHNKKHIPDVCKYAALADQKALLAGLIDTTGRIEESGRITVRVFTERVAKDLIELLTIMGIEHYGVVATKIGGKTRHDVSFSLPYNIPTFRHKKLPTIPLPRRKISIVKVEKVENAGQGNCIMVDSPDGMYLVGESLIPTHNSFLNAFIAIANAALGGKEVRIGGATRDKAGLIQEKIVSLLPTASKEIQDGLVITDEDGDVNKKVQRLATQASKEALAWKSGGSIKLFSTNETKKSADIAAAGAVGVGGDVVLLDEIQIMSPIGFRTASRFFMENNDTKRFCVGNPQINGHFRDLYDDPTTFVVHMNDSSAIIEGRMTRRQMELTGMPTYSNEYRSFVLTEFPPDNAGNRFFTTLPSVYDKTAFPTPSQKISFMGIDSAYKGADSLIVTIVTLNISPERIWVSLDYQEDMKTRYPVWDDTMTTLNICLDVLKLVERYGIERVSIDIGMGVQLYETLLRLSPDLDIEPVAFGSLPTEWRAETDFNAKWALNKRAEMHLDLKELCESQMMYIAPEYYDDLIKQIREVGNSEQGQKIKIEAKKEIKRRLGQSPDALDSLCLAVRSLVLSGILRGENDASVDDMVQVYGGQ
nr:MAG TPA: DNA packaging protein [Caudoviricetes sp.]